MKAHIYPDKYTPGGRTELVESPKSRNTWQIAAKTVALANRQGGDDNYPFR